MIKPKKLIDISIAPETFHAAQRHFDSMGTTVQNVVTELIEEAADTEAANTATANTTPDPEQSRIQEKEMSLSDFRRRSSDAFEYTNEPDRVILLTSHGIKRSAIMSVETYRRMKKRRKQ